MKEILIYCDKEVELTKIEYVLTNINIHPFCKSIIHFSSTNQIETADLLYSNDAINQRHQFKMFPLKKLLLKEIDSSVTLGLNQVLGDSKVLNFVCVNERKKDLFLIDKMIYEDLFETLFFHWSRYEEVVFPKHQRNEWDLMPEEDLFVVKYDLYHQPFLDDLILWFVRLFVPDHQPNLKFEIIHTYDIDYLHFDELSPIENFRIFLSILLRSKKPIGGSRQFFKSLFKKDTVLSYMDNPNTKKIIYILCGGRHKFDFPKSFKALQNIQQFIHICKDNGYEIGIHPSFEACYSLDLFQKEIETLIEMTKSNITKSRQHYLHMDYKVTIPILEHLGIKEDTTTGFNLRVGYKIGTCHDFHYWNWLDDKCSPVICKPMIWMDSAQWFQSNKNIINYSKDKTHFFKSNEFGNLCINHHPILQNKLACYG